MKELIETTNLYYFHSILEIGGIETFFYYLAKKYKDWDLTIVYKEGNAKQLERFSTNPEWNLNVQEHSLISIQI